ncbi:MAG: aspartyl/asparaginyl beta-hydroxylase domain-containing protein [Sphingobium sp.]|nr:aspartyl/asparaginyl beta-hydroxylase domain-containing protein [Sphingobium sp.]|tara:strand:+ start:1544 stop:2245 length:702 start_codon:yes stop_codon:yes gene_type:complete
MRPSLDALIARSSRVPNDPALDPAMFPWTEMLRSNWGAIQSEALAVTQSSDAVPTLREISPDHTRIATDEGWRSFFLIGYGQRVERNLARCPRTEKLLRQVPGLNSAFFSVLRPGTHIPKHRGVTKGLLTCHLGLQVPRGAGLFMTVGTQTLGWREGETLVFDDTWHHEVWNGTNGTRIVLLVQFERPLAQPGRAIAQAFLAGIRRSAFVKEALKNIDRWQRAFDELDQREGS